MMNDEWSCWCQEVLIKYCSNIKGRLSSQAWHDNFRKNCLLKLVSFSGSKKNEQILVRIPEIKKPNIFFGWGFFTPTYHKIIHIRYPGYVYRISTLQGEGNSSSKDKFQPLHSHETSPMCIWAMKKKNVACDISLTSLLWFKGTGIYFWIFLFHGLIMPYEIHPWSLT